MNTPITASVVIPCYNCGDVLSRAVQSALAQKTPPAEILIVDDQSTDNSFDIAKNLAGKFPAVQTIQQQVRTGPGAARNAGLRKAAGRYVCFLDADDEYSPEFLATAVPLLEENFDLAWVTTDIELVNNHRDIHPIQVEDMIESLPSNIVIRKTAAELIGGFPESQAILEKPARVNALFREALQRWFKGIYLSAKLLRYWVKRGSHFDFFLDHSKIIGNKVVFTNESVTEENRQSIEAMIQYRENVQERVAILSSLTRMNESFPPFLERLFKVICEFDELRTSFDAVGGLLNPQEGYVLYHFARHGPSQGAIVDIGSQLGRSTCWLAAGARDAQREKVVSIDPFRCFSQHKIGGPQPEAPSGANGAALPTFLATMQKLGLRNWVDTRVGTSDEIGPLWQDPIRLLFIGGEHSYQTMCRHEEIWSKHVVTEGFLAFHNVHIHPGVTDFYRELLQANRLWREVCNVRSLRVIQRII